MDWQSCTWAVKGKKLKKHPPETKNKLKQKQNNETNSCVTITLNYGSRAREGCCASFRGARAGCWSFSLTLAWIT